jgi:hypothetical protein
MRAVPSLCELYTLEFTLLLRKKHGKTSVRVVEKCPDMPVAIVKYTFTQTIKRTTQMGQNTQN